eukprot:scaffold1708_cov322-Pavlova_lutheri.AAC.3
MASPRRIPTDANPNSAAIIDANANMTVVGKRDTQRWEDGVCLSALTRNGVPLGNDWRRWKERTHATCGLCIGWRRRSARKRKGRTLPKDGWKSEKDARRSTRVCDGKEHREGARDKRLARRNEGRSARRRRTRRKGKKDDA